MIPFTQVQIAEILSELESKKISSKLGFFSEPFRINYNGNDLIVKTYLPIRNNSLVSSIMENHNNYIAKLNSIGIKIPETIITTKQIKNKRQLIIIQEPFNENELIRDLIKKASIAELLNLCNLLFNDILKFWNGKRNSTDIGFHPTLRNYALHKSELYYFDTFPPMLMDQKKLNHIILAMAPYDTLIKKIIPSQLINRVSDEYYHLDKMFIGIAGSCCRLRPDDSEQILAFSIKYVDTCLSISEDEKESIKKLLQTPPNLSKLWILIRKLTGNMGEPNIKSSAGKRNS